MGAPESKKEHVAMHILSETKRAMALPGANVLRYKAATLFTNELVSRQQTC